MGLIWRHGGEIGDCMGWIFGLQFCFDGWLFLIDGCGFALLFFFFFLQWFRSAIDECLAEILFLWWLGVFAVAGSFLPVGGCGCHGGVVTCGGGGLWWLQWWLWQVERW